MKKEIKKQKKVRFTRLDISCEKIHTPKTGMSGYDRRREKQLIRMVDYNRGEYENEDRYERYEN